MKIVLLREVKNLGKTGEIKEVASGYAQNFLFPKKFAVMATDGNVKTASAMKQKEVVKKKRSRVDTEKLKKLIQAKTITIKANASETGHLFAGIGSREIGQAINKELKIKVDYLTIKINKKIKSLGEHEVEIKVGGETVEVKVVVARE